MRSSNTFYVQHKGHIWQTVQDFKNFRSAKRCLWSWVRSTNFVGYESFRVIDENGNITMLTLKEVEEAMNDQY